MSAQVRHQPYYTVASFLTLPWLAAGKVYYLGDHQSARAADAGLATAGCPTILLKPHAASAAPSARAAAG